MSKIFQMIIDHKKAVIVIFLCFAVMSIVFLPSVSVNYNMVDYLPPDAQSTDAITVIEDEFDGEMPNARVMIENVTIQEALEYKQKIAMVHGVTSVTWLDDIVGLDTLTTTPVEFMDRSVVQNYYRDKTALITISIGNGFEKVAVRAIRNIIGENNAIAGDAVNTATSQEMSSSEVLNAMAILVPIIIIILLFSTTSWVEPLLFILTIGIAVVINIGTNVLFKQISFITQAISPILQLAVSLDYAVFLLHSFNEYRLMYEPEEAMKLAMEQALSTVSSSAATTVIGFIALMAMRFGIGADLGLNLVKGVLLSFISVMMFLPSFTLIFYKFIDKTKHRPLTPSFVGLGKYLMKIRIPFLVVALLIAIPCFLAQSNTEFMYGTSGVTGTSRAGKDAALIDKQFGSENILALVVPKGEPGKESELCSSLRDIPYVTSVVSYAAAIGSEIPPEYVPPEVTEQFYSENYARIVIYTDMEEESQEAFDTVESIMKTAARYYDTYYLAGQSATLHDMRNTVSVDTGIVNFVAIIGIFIVLLVTFRSLLIPPILLFTIETAIWINLSFAYFAGKSINFIGYLVISTVQLGATVDYAILLTNNYLLNRKKLSKKEAMKTTIEGSLIAILISALILSLAGFALSFTSNNPVISELGILFGRGTVLSFVMVVCVLPALLLLFDKIIQKTTLGNKFI